MLQYVNVDSEEPKNVVYQFSNSWHDEVERDLGGELSLGKDGVAWRGGKVWKVQSITWEDDISDGQQNVPTLWVSLVQMRVN